MFFSRSGLSAVLFLFSFFPIHLRFRPAATCFAVAVFLFLVVFTKVFELLIPFGLNRRSAVHHYSVAPSIQSSLQQIYHYFRPLPAERKIPVWHSKFLTSASLAYSGPGSVLMFSVCCLQSKSISNYIIGACCPLDNGPVA